MNITTDWLKTLQVGDRVLVKDILTQQQYPGILRQRLGTTAYIEEESTGVELVTTSQLPFSLETGRHINFLGESFLILLPPA